MTTSGPHAVVLRGPVLYPDSPDRVKAWADGFVRLDADGRIAASGPWEPGVAGESDRVVETGRALVLPAFVDAHVHLPQLDVRGSWGLPLLQWLDRWVYPAEAAFADPDHAEAVATRFFAALAAAGVGTAAVFGTVHAAAVERAFRVAETSGLRVLMGKVLMDRSAPDALLEPAEAGIRASLALAERWEGAAGGRLGYAITPRFAPTCSQELLAAAGRAARDSGLRIQTHLSESPGEVARVAELFPDAPDYLAVYARVGLVGEGTVLAHAIHCSDGEYGRIAGGGAAIACCPSSNAFLGSGAFPLARAREAGARIAVGSDVGAGPQFSPLDVLRHLAHLGDVGPAELLWRGTAAGAEALGFGGATGRLTAGSSADIVLLEPPEGAPADPLEAFTTAVFRQPETRVVATLVEGRVIHGSLQTNL